MFVFATSTIRRQFEQANLEAMDESAEWRMKYDKEVEKNRKLHDDLSKVLLAYQILVHGYAMLLRHSICNAHVRILFTG
jgi:hypothetical protein